MKLNLGDTEFIISSDQYGPFVVTKFADGAFVLARPINEPLADVVQHEWTHVWLSWCLFGEVSDVLWWLAHPDLIRDHDRVAREEAAVLRICEHLRQPPTDVIHRLAT